MESLTSDFVLAELHMDPMLGWRVNSIVFASVFHAMLCSHVGCEECAGALHSVKC